MKHFPWLLCPTARDEAERTGVVERCDPAFGRQHNCNGERTPYLWPARNEKGEEFESEEPCCGSCNSDQDYYGPRGEGEGCCCIHREGKP